MLIKNMTALLWNVNYLPIFELIYSLNEPVVIITFKKKELIFYTFFYIYWYICAVKQYLFH